MSRPIKFMVRDYTKNDWIFYTGIFGHKSPRHEGSTFPQYESCPVIHKVSKPFEFTGLLDKDGKEIYEGHIVVIDDMSTPMIVVYQAPSFVMKEKLTNKRWSEFVICHEHNQLQTIIGHIADKD